MDLFEDSLRTSCYAVKNTQHHHIYLQGILLNNDWASDVFQTLSSPFQWDCIPFVRKNDLELESYLRRVLR